MTRPSARLGSLGSLEPELRELRTRFLRLGVKKRAGRIERRRCGPCSECCTTMAVETIRKPAHVRCPHLKGRGCGIHDSKPTLCRAFFCAWRAGLLHDVDRPDLRGVVVVAEVWPGGRDVYTVRPRKDASPASVRRVVEMLAEESGPGTYVALVPADRAHGAEVRAYLVGSPEFSELLRGIGA